MPLDPGGEPLPSPYRLRASIIGGDRVAYTDVALKGWREAMAMTRSPSGVIETAPVGDASEIALALPEPGLWEVRWTDAVAGCRKSFTVEVIPP